MAHIGLRGILQVQVRLSVRMEEKTEATMWGFSLKECGGA